MRPPGGINLNDICPRSGWMEMVSSFSAFMAARAIAGSNPLCKINPFLLPPTDGWSEMELVRWLVGSSFKI